VTRKSNIDKILNFFSETLRFVEMSCDHEGSRITLKSKRWPHQLPTQKADRVLGSTIFILIILTFFCVSPHLATFISLFTYNLASMLCRSFKHLALSQLYFTRYGCGKSFEETSLCFH
jgi:hypothetical protein